MQQVILGIDQLRELPPCWLKEVRIGLLVNQASVDSASRPTKDIIAELTGKNLTVLFSPQHGIRGQAQANMVETEDEIDLHLNIPIYSGGLTSSTVRQRLSELDRAKALQEQEVRRTTGLARSAFLSLQADIATVQARQQAVVSTQTSLDATLAGYDAGTRTSVDVLLSQRQLFGAKRDYSVARYTYLTNSLVLKQVAGLLTIEDVEMMNKWLEPRPAKPEQQ